MKRTELVDLTLLSDRIRPHRMYSFSHISLGSKLLSPI